MKTILLFLCGFTAMAQTYSVGQRSLTWTDPARNNREIPVEIYYPANTSGSNVAVAEGVFASVAFGHGFVMSWDAYENIWEMLVPQGFIVAFPKTETGLVPSHGTFAQDLSFVLARLQAEAVDPTSPFYQKVSPQNALMGHSMGGGAAVLAASASPVTALATLAAANTNPSAIAAAGNVSVPALYIAGANDCVTPIGQHQQPMFEASASSCKTFVSITGGNHCQMANSNFFCSLGEATCSPSATINREQQHQAIASVLINWLKATLYNDCEAASDFEDTLEAGQGITSQNNCTLCPLQTQEFTSGPFKVLNPIGIALNIQSDVSAYSIRLIDPSGRQVLTAQGSGSISVDCGELASGWYVLELAHGNSISRVKIVK